MKHLGQALALATAYLESRNENYTEDDDVRTLETIATILREATSEEHGAITEAFKELGKPELVEGLGLHDPYK